MVRDSFLKANSNKTKQKRVQSEVRYSERVSSVSRPFFTLVGVCISLTMASSPITGCVTLQRVAREGGRGGDWLWRRSPNDSVEGVVMAQRQALPKSSLRLRWCSRWP